jgi:hypothetical protein
MRTALGVMLVCFIGCMVCGANSDEGATKPTPEKVIDAINY